MAQLILTRSSPFHRAIRTNSMFPLSLRIGKFFLVFSMTFMIGMLSFFYLVKFTEIHTKGYELRKLELERGRLLNLRESQSTGIAQLRSLSAVRDSSIAKTMIPMKNPVFVKEESGVAALPALWEPGNP